MSAPDPRAVLDDLADRRRRCTTAIATLAAFYGLDPAPWLDETPAVSHETIAPARDTKSHERRTKNHEPRMKRAKGDTARPTGAPAERILAALKQAGAPMSPGQVAAATKMSVGAVGYHVRALVRAKQVHAEGATMNRRLSLA